MLKQLYQTTGNASLDDCLDLIIGAVREVRDRPTSIDKDFIIERIDELRKDGKGGQNLLITQHVTNFTHLEG